jgi:hypothetical protein
MNERRTIEALMTSACLALAMTNGCASSNRAEEPESPAKQSAASAKAEPDSGTAQNSDALATCHWDARLDRGADAPRGACHAKRRLLSCTAGGATEICLTDDVQCTPGTDKSACEDQCEPDEYAIACGAIGPDTGNPDPPAACHSTINTPGGTFYMCCPCE